MVRQIVCLLVGVTLVLLSGWAGASEAAERRVVVLDFTGVQGAGVRAWVVRRVQDVPGIAVASRAEVLGEGGSSPESPEGIVGVAEEGNLCALLRGETRGKNGKWTLRLEVLNGATGEPVDTVEFESTWVMGIKKEIDAHLVERVGPVLDRCETPQEAEEAAAPEPTDETEPEPEPEDEDAEPEPPQNESKRKPKPQKARPTAIELELAVPFFTRQLSYEEDVTQTLRSYRLKGLAPGVEIGGTWYPGAHLTSGAGAHIGITGGYYRGFPAAAEREGREFDTSTQGYRVGLRGRLPVQPIELGVSVEYGAHDYEVAKDSVTGQAVVPNVGYRFVRPGLEARLRLGVFLAELTGGYRILFDTGELESSEFFPELTGNGWDASLAAGVGLGPIQLLAGGALTRYRFELNPSASDPSPYGAAGVATDRSAAGFLLVRAALGGEGD